MQKAAVRARELAEQAASGESPSHVHLRDLELAKAAEARWPAASQSGRARDEAEAHYAAALQLYGEKSLIRDWLH